MPSWLAQAVTRARSHSTFASIFRRMDADEVLVTFKSVDRAQPGTVLDSRIGIKRNAKTGRSLTWFRWFLFPLGLAGRRTLDTNCSTAQKSNTGKSLKQREEAGDRTVRKNSTG